ncbi:4'-phosphopantetheinyl transferase family protein [Flavobacterium caeni]|uniref:Phosphopantetheinyl transferase n=1 Tax=Flavobacterium caeni TaxID=490189 RepID=A0A1G5IJW8_9FLAO|nr:4'-phosphopantetheinyl transferase superfamily protein [Flavobacterium caeni]SCY76415.1 Phosphopantetheinyl transferase [Flavobacterium caeni]
MPLYRTIHHDPHTQIHIWKITERESDLLSQVTLNEKNQLRLQGMKSELHRRGFLSVRKLLQHVGYSDFDLYYDQTGKPHLHDGRHISITHSHEFSAIVLSDQNIGIDMEKQREKIKIIADKFTAPLEETYLNRESDDYIQKLTVIWGTKEAIFKVRNEIGISFKDHIALLPFEINDQKANAILSFNQTTADFSVCFEEIENFTLVYVVENTKP